ncbi:MAG: hypothetical protein IJD60_01655 [Clostridia bacterium]|nr:hypothetical protein [Clostridia bacterium]
MDDIISLIVVFIIYLVAASSGKKKKKKKQRGMQRSFEQMQRSYEQLQRMAGEGKPAQQAPRGEIPAYAPTISAAPPRPQARTEEPCHDVKGMHLHEVTQAQMLDAQEGEDPCHAGEAEPASAPEAYADEAELERRALAQDVLRGVIMSEVLTRPCERRAMQRNGRRA